MGVIDHCEPHERTWRLQLRRELKKRELQSLRRKLSWIGGLATEDTERLLRGEELVLTAVDLIVGAIQLATGLATPRIPLDAELLTPDIPACTHTEIFDPNVPENVHVIRPHIVARDTRQRAHKEAIHAEH